MTAHYLETTAGAQTKADAAQAAAEAAAATDATTKAAGAVTTADAHLATHAADVALHGGAPAILAKGAVCVFLDDISASHNTTCIPAANSRGQRLTLPFATTFLDASGRMTTAQVQAAANAGHELVAHGTDHSSMTGLTSSQRVAQYDACVATLEGFVGSGNVKNWAYPNGNSARSATTDTELFLRFKRLFATCTQAGGAAPYLLRRDEPTPFLIGRFPWSDTNHGYALNLVHLAADQPIIVCLYAHDVGNTGQPSAVQFTALLDLALALDVPVITASEALAAGVQLIDGGFEDSTLVNWAITNTGSGTATGTSAADTPDTGLPGTRSLKLSVTTATDAIYATQRVPVKPGRVYTISGRYRGQPTGGAGTGGYVRARSHAYDGTASLNAQSAVCNSATWTSFSFDVTASTSDSELLIEPIVNAVSGDFYFDHLCFGPKNHGTFG